MTSRRPRKRFKGGKTKKAPDFSGAFPIVFEVDAYEA